MEGEKKAKTKSKLTFGAIYGIGAKISPNGKAA